jgi:hypothetical protein
MPDLGLLKHDEVTAMRSHCAGSSEPEQASAYYHYVVHRSHLGRLRLERVFRR